MSGRASRSDPAAGAAPAGRWLIVNADDLGQSAGVNDGILEAHARGIVTSASLMVRWPAAAEAAARSRDSPELSLGLHLDLGEWICTEGEWTPLYEVVPAGDAAAVAEEVGRQLAAFRRLTGRDPTHIDSHQHVHRSEPVRSVVREVARTLGIPARHDSPVRYCGDFYGQMAHGVPLPGAISAEHLVSIVRGLLPGVTELACHPGAGDDLNSMYRGERAVEVAALCDPGVRATIAAEGVRLCSFGALARRAEGVRWADQRPSQ